MCLPLRLFLHGVSGVAVLLFLFVFPVQAKFDTGEYFPTISGGRISGNGPNANVTLSTAHFEAVHYFRKHLGFFSQASVLRSSGKRDGRKADTTALGLLFGLRWHFFQCQRYGLFADWGGGLMLGRGAFPPGGTRLNWVSGFGLGVNVDTGMGFSLLAGLKQVHISNGKGQVEENPSFDGLGLHLGFTLRPGFRPPFPAPLKSKPFGGKKVLWRLEAIHDFQEDGESSGGAVAVDIPLRHAYGAKIQLAAEAAELVGDLIWKGSVRVYREVNFGRVLVGYSRQEFNVFSSNLYEFQAERVLNDVSTVSGELIYEEKNLDRDRVFGGLFLTVYPAPFAAITSGIGFERQKEGVFNSIDNLNDAGVSIGVEISPRSIAGAGISAFFKIGTGNETQIAGIRFQPGNTASLVERHRGGGVRLWK